MAYYEHGVTIKDENSEMYSRSLEVRVTRHNPTVITNGFSNGFSISDVSHTLDSAIELPANVATPVGVGNTLMLLHCNTNTCACLL
jgi:hypothetical protein